MNSTMNQEVPISPSSNVDRVRTKEIERLVNDFLHDTMKMTVGGSFIYNTIFIRYFEALVSLLNQKMQVTQRINQTINICDIFTATVSLKVNNDAEKTGNINVVFDMPDDAPLLLDLLRERMVPVKKENEPERFYILPKEDQVTMIEDIKKIESAANAALVSKNRIIIRGDFILTTVAIVFLVATIQNIIQECIDLGKRGRHFNLMDVMELYVQNKDGNYHIKMSPGEDSKLRIKYDGLTETDG